MSIKTRVVLITIACCFLAAHAELVQVIEIFRHGSRGPIAPTQYDAAQWHEEDFGQLNAAGLRMHYNLGRRLREDYGDFLHKQLNLTEFIVYSTDYNRTILSATAQLHGLFAMGDGLKLPGYDAGDDRTPLSAQYLVPPYEGTIDYANASQFALPQGIQAVPIHVMPETDMVISNYCPGIDDLFARAYARSQSDYSAMHETVQSSLSGELREIFGTRFTNLTELSDLYDVIASDKWASRPLPENFTATHWRRLSLVQSWLWAFYVGEGEYNRITATPFFQEVLWRFANKTAAGAHEPPLKWVMFSAHDMNLARLMGALNFTCHKCLFDMYQRDLAGETEQQIADAVGQCEVTPNYASSMLFELHRDQNAPAPDNYFVKVRYNGRYMQLCESNNTQCSLDEFSARLKASFVADPVKQCAGTGRHTNMTITNACSKDAGIVNIDATKESDSSQSMISIILGIVCAVQFVAICYLYRRYRLFVKSMDAEKQSFCHSSSDIDARKQQHKKEVYVP